MWQNRCDKPIADSHTRRSLSGSLAEVSGSFDRGRRRVPEQWLHSAGLRYRFEVPAIESAGGAGMPYQSFDTVHRIGLAIEDDCDRDLVLKLETDSGRQVLELES